MKLYRVEIEVPYRGASAADEDKTADAEHLQQIASSSGVVATEKPWYGPQLLLVADLDLGDVLTALCSRPGFHTKSVALVFDRRDPAASVAAMVDRLELAALRLTGGFNEHSGSPVAGPHLLSIAWLKIVEDYCTDALQAELDNGWRIMAVCPQESRRPDYVLGRPGEPGKQYGSAER